MKTYQFDTIVIGSGCAGYNAADCLFDYGHRNIAIVTEGENSGTSRNTGSDKQTYYKLGISSDSKDSISDMANTLFQGKCVNGDTAFVEAACSLRSFFKLVQLGVPFPTNEFGEYVGYRTDHDENKRATSAGPLTSKYMTRALQRSVMEKGIQVLDSIQIFQLIKENERICGAIGIHLSTLEYVLFQADQIILATGGPAAIYESSVYPKSQTGMSGMAFEIGAKSANLQEWQYGIASTDFRWNVSGTYQQVLPRYISVDEEGREHEFLPEYFNHPIEAINLVFKKGYEWPFDSNKIIGSSMIDMIIYSEIHQKGRKVYMDFLHEPKGFDFNELSEEAYTYLKNSNALISTPIKRLEKMNQRAIDLYTAQGIDLYRSPLRVAVCAQHNNGGLAIDINYETSIKGLYAVGESAGTFGVYRPGGTALNSTQVGSMRAAQHIAQKEKNSASPCLKFQFEAPKTQKNDDCKIERYTAYFKEQMSKYASILRNPKEIKRLYMETELFLKDTPIPSESNLPKWFKLKDMVLTANQVLNAMLLWCEYVKNRGGAIVLDETKSLLRQNPKQNTAYDDQIICTMKQEAFFEKVRNIPETDTWFESVYNKFKQEML